MPDGPTVRGARSGGPGAWLRRGMGAGLVAGVAAGLFQLVVGEPSVERAIELERMTRMASEVHSAEVVSRGVQRAGMVMATGLYGLAVGAVLAVVMLGMAGRMRGTVRTRSMKLALAGFGAVWLVPFLRYPSDPPAVGDPATIGSRTASYLVLAAVCVCGSFLAAAVARRQAARGVAPYRRRILAGATYGALVTVAFVLLPPSLDAGSVPPDLLWQFRLASAAGQAILWTATGLLLGLLGSRAERRSALR
jgi:hypothetical protein